VTVTNVYPKKQTPLKTKNPRSSNSRSMHRGYVRAESGES